MSEGSPEDTDVGSTVVEVAVAGGAVDVTGVAVDVTVVDLTVVDGGSVAGEC